MNEAVATDPNKLDLLVPDAPEAVFVESTNKCNLKCVMCPTPSMRREQGFLTMDVLEGIVHSLPEGTPVGLNNWGEPLLHQRIVEMVAFLDKAGFEPEFVTNATLLRGDRVRELIEAGLRKIYVSMDGIEDDYEKIRGLPFEKVKANLEGFLALRPPELMVFLRITLQEQNV